MKTTERKHLMLTKIHAPTANDFWNTIGSFVIPLCCLSHSQTMGNHLRYLILLILATLMWASHSYGQSSEKVLKLDSLLKVNTDYPKDDTIKIENIARIATMYGSMSAYPEALDYWYKALEGSQKLNDKQRILRFYGNIGIEYTAMANYPKALEYHQKALLLAEQLNNKGMISTNLNSLGRVYMFLGDYPKALEYYEKALAISEKLGFKGAIARQHRNIGNTYCKMCDYPKALEHLQLSQQLFEQLGNTDGEAIGLGIIGNVYFSLADYEQSLEYTQKALTMNRQYGNKRQESMNLVSLGKIYRDAPDQTLQKLGVNPSKRYPQTLEYLYLGQKTANEIRDPGTEKTAWEAISNTYEKEGDYANAFTAYKQYIILRDSVESQEIKSKMTIKEMQFDFDKKETKLLFDQQLTFEKLRQQELLMCQHQQDLDIKQQQLLFSQQEKDIQHLAYLKTQAELRQQQIAGENQLAITAQKDAELKLLNKEKTLQKTQLELTTNELNARENQRNAFIVGSILLLFFAGAVAMGLFRTFQEKKKSEALLLNILPSEVAKELKQTGGAAAKQYNHVTVLFTDFVNFTGISEQLTPTELVAVIHANFTAFDSIIEKHGLEKIKTIGDAYLAVCGLPHESPDHAQRVVKAAFDIQQHMNQSGGAFQIRIGINSGPVVAGIVGVKKYAYDIWGDTVNTAARMEQHSEAGKINISGTTYELVNHQFDCTYRGKIQAKNKGEVDMYFVNRSLSEG